MGLSLAGVVVIVRGDDVLDEGNLRKVCHEVREVERGWGKRGTWRQRHCTQDNIIDSRQRVSFAFSV